MTTSCAQFFVLLILLDDQDVKPVGNASGRAGISLKPRFFPPRPFFLPSEMVDVLFPVRRGAQLDGRDPLGYLALEG